MRCKASHGADKHPGHAAFSSTLSMIGALLGTDQPTFYFGPVRPRFYSPSSQNTTRRGIGKQFLDH
jgi:hypothetical protein